MEQPYGFNVVFIIKIIAFNKMILMKQLFPPLKIAIRVVEKIK